MSSQPESTKNLWKDGDDEDENGADNSKNGNFGGDLLICISCGMRYSSVDNLIQHILGSHQVNLVTAESLLSYAFQDESSACSRIQAVLQLHKTYERHSNSVENKAKDMDLISGAVVSILRSATTNAEKPSESSALKLGNQDNNTEEEDPGKDLEEGGDLVMCISCGIRYSSVDNLIQHILGSHSGNLVTAESLLHYGFQDGSSDAKIQAVLKLRKSLRNKDKNTEEEDPEKNREEVLGEEQYICEYCKEGFWCRKKFRQHLLNYHHFTKEYTEVVINTILERENDRKLNLKNKNLPRTKPTTSKVIKNVIDNNAKPSSSGSTSENTCEPIVQPVTNISTEKKRESVTIPGPSSASCRRSTRLHQKKQAEGNNSSKCEQAGVLAISTGGLEKTSPNRVENAVSFSPTVMHENSVSPGLVGSSNEIQNDNHD
ncbi:unnamed protein product [Orchesella dallaii]|uniref:C2H2-type domain-containing protein n=1 Tax=Orchesella dallaii TaxID=48710 RepID=A0ABP1PX40_9HEXA